MPIDEKRLAELKAAELEKFAGQTKITTEKHVVYAVTIDMSNADVPRAVIHSRNVLTGPSGIAVNGESEETIAALDPAAPPFSKATARGGLTGEMTTVGDMINVLAGFSIDAVAERRARQLAELEAPEKLEEPEDRSVIAPKPPYFPADR